MASNSEIARLEKTPGVYENSKDLEALLTQAVEVVPQLEHARNFKVGILFVNKSLGKKLRVGKCSLVPGGLRFKTGIDILIQIKKKDFLIQTREEQLETVIHEIYHVSVAERSEGRKLKPAIREHEGDFCELREHDNFIRGLVEKYGKKLDRVNSLPHQETLGGS